MLAGQILITMSTKEIDRLEVVKRVLERRLTRVKAAALMSLNERQVRRMCAAYEAEGAFGLISRRRGRPSNNRSHGGLQEEAMRLIREHYSDFGPTLATEKLIELHGLRISRETVRHWMKNAGLWLTRKQRVPRPHQPRERRACLGELIQIDGSPHAWFEERGPDCSLLVYVDDATGRLMELRFAKTESAFDYFTATLSYLRHHGKPVAFYSDKHSIFRVTQEGKTGPNKGITQFGRALAELNVDIICANTAQAKGRVERMNLTLQDRLVKELRLAGVSSMEEGNAFAPKFMEDFNRRFACVPRNPHNAHRPVGDQNIDAVFSWQENRTMSRNLVVHYKRVSYLIEPTPETLQFGRRQVSIHEWQDGRVEIHCAGLKLPYSMIDKQPHVSAGDVVENKRLGAVLATILVKQTERDDARLASPKMTILQKDRLRAKRQAPQVTPAPVGQPTERKPGRLTKVAAQQPRIALAGIDPQGPVQAFFDRFAIEQAERRRRYSVKGNDRKREREFEAVKARSWS